CRRRHEPGGLRRDRTGRPRRARRRVRPRRAALAVVPRHAAVLGLEAVLSRLGPLREREYALLFTGRAVSQLGSAMAPVALAFAILDLTGSTTDTRAILCAP